MSRTIEILNSIFDHRFIEDSHEAISEPAEDMTRDINKGNLSDEDILICRLDQGSNLRIDLFPYIRDKSHMGLRSMKRICDYAIFVDKDEKLFILLFELKKGKESPTEQLEVTVPLIEFIFKRAKILKHLDNISYEVRKIGITDEVGKPTTAYRGEVVYDDNQFTKLYKSKRIDLRRFLH